MFYILFRNFFKQKTFYWSLTQVLFAWITVFENFNFFAYWSGYAKRPNSKKRNSRYSKAADVSKTTIGANVYLQSEIRMIDCRSVYLPQIDFIDNFWHESISFFPLYIISSQKQDNRFVNSVST